ncbi:hypothetical protein CPJ18_22775 [Agrobacterium rosae]|uniref:Uncharacterized protein n=2 Tax=Agrobacterium rosae TaxID=1972867 RepID=A0AAE5RU28_9HYPH|nr:hypothetical protein DXM21_22890 [Agrobacterium rosae]KAA3513992.1 hypothetical protein DXM25_23080 [Agrobacterium rosae]MQB50980.1 hypothetical protein [Agrobacterium rosae]POO49083.1 hypothetical protein CPJ18_22775 [Agrobacterium rosae]
MPKRKLSREELFALVWEKPTSEIAKELGLSDVAIGKLCTKLQVPKPPRGYWARMQAGQRPRRPALVAFREELDTKRRDELRAKTAESLSKLQRQFLEMALSDMNNRGAGIASPPGAKPLANLDRDVAAQILLLIQGRAQAWVEDGRIATRWGPSVRNSVAKLVERLLPMARQQLVVFETESKRTSFMADGPVIFVRLTVPLQERIAALSAMVRDQELQHVVMPLTAADHAWSTHHLYSPESHLFLDSWLCVSAREIWVEWNRKSWREEEPPERHATNRIGLREVMPVDFLSTSNKVLSPVVSRVAITPYADRLRALQEAERVHEMMSTAAYAMQREVPGEILSVVDRLWFGEERPFQAARDAFRHVETELERWDTELEAERSALARSILGIVPGDIVTSESRGKLLRLSVTGVTLYSGGSSVSFMVSGIRFRKDGTLGKLQETLNLSFTDEKHARR